MDHYAGRQMQGREICRLLPVSEQRLSTVIGELDANGLVSMAETYYRITDKGARRLAQFADEVLGVPARVESELRNNAAYGSLIAFAGQLIDALLRSKFEAAKERARPTRGSEHSPTGTPTRPRPG
jgi:DNA-binding PadR family transcriptional regulator